MRRWLILLLGMGGVLPGVAQSVHVARGVSGDGSLIGEDEEFSLWTQAQPVVFLYRQDTVIRMQRIFFFVDVKAGPEYIPFSNVAAYPETGQNWAAQNLQFAEMGTYRVTAADSAGNALASRDFTLKAPETRHLPADYEAAVAVFTHDTEEGEPVDTVRTTIGAPDSTLYLSVRNGDELRTWNLVVDVWRIQPEEGEVWVRSQQFRVLPEWYHTRIPCPAEPPGTYVYRVYSAEDIFIAEAQIRFR